MYVSTVTTITIILSNNTTFKKKNNVYNQSIMSSKTIRMYATAAVMLFSGTYGFHVTEKLSLLDSFYLSGITFTTIGYGDLPAPVTRSK